MADLLRKGSGLRTRHEGRATDGESLSAGSGIAFTILDQRGERGRIERVELAERNGLDEDDGAGMGALRFSAEFGHGKLLADNDPLAQEDRKDLASVVRAARDRAAVYGLPTGYGAEAALALALSYAYIVSH
ncbi:MAG TPA: hypothetical protein H9823_00150 [Candidatus Rubneribacter avistercoris]|nr:hypothetical protein [Candidatus Rubneribacter avistercoris]